MEKNEISKEKRQLEIFDKVWSQALLAMSTAEDEASRIAGRLGEVAGWSQDEVKRQVRELTERLKAQRRELEKNVEDGVKRAVQRFKVPRREEIQALSARLDQVSRRIEQLETR